LAGLASGPGVAGRTASFLMWSGTVLMAGLNVHCDSSASCGRSAVRASSRQRSVGVGQQRSSRRANGSSSCSEAAGHAAAALGSALTVLQRTRRAVCWVQCWGETERPHTLTSLMRDCCSACSRRLCVSSCRRVTYPSSSSSFPFTCHTDREPPRGGHSLDLRTRRRPAHGGGETKPTRRAAYPLAGGDLRMEREPLHLLLLPLLRHLRLQSQRPNRGGVNTRFAMWSFLSLLE